MPERVLQVRQIRTADDDDLEALSRQEPPRLRPQVFMSETLDLFALGHSAVVLRTPSWLGPEIYEEIALAFEPGDYKITPGDRWTVVALKTGQTVYSGIGPVETACAKAAISATTPLCIAQRE